MHKFIIAKKSEIEQITNQVGVTAYIGKDSVSLSGPQAAIDQVKLRVNQIIINLQGSLYSEFISNNLQCQILQ